MKKLPSIKAVKMAIIMIISVCSLSLYTQDNQTAITINTNLNKQYEKQNKLTPITVELVDIEKYVEEPIIYEQFTLSELAEKINRSLKSSLKGYGYTFAKKSLDYGIDPYVAVAIVLLETGCSSGSCSNLCRNCNNVGGMKGQPNCGGAYKKFKTMDEGIDAFLKNLANNYYKKGLTTIEQIGSKYAESSTWATKVHDYTKKIRNA